MELPLKERVVYAAMALPARLGLSLGLEMKQLVDLMQMAVFHETRRQDLKTAEAAERLGVSMRKISMLSQRLRRNFADDEAMDDLERRIEFMLWASPLTQARLHQLLRGFDHDEIDAATDALLAAGRIRATEDPQGPLYTITRSESRLVSEDWQARLDGLTDIVSTVANTVDARLIHGDARSFARNLMLRIRPGDLHELHTLYSDVIWETLRQLDFHAKDDPDAEEISVSILWAPYQYITRRAKLSKGDLP